MLAELALALSLTDEAAERLFDSAVHGEPRPAEPDLVATAS